ncbi:MAG: YraN family protein [Parcubacteria group bacterium]|jgi:putative endonuclease
MTITPKKSLGNLGETISANYLRNKGYEIIALNYANPSGRRLGEIDIIAKDKAKDELVFVEVKSREMQKFKNTNPEENVNYHKMQKLDKIAYFYLKQNNLTACDYRFDVIAVWINEITRRAKIKHIRSI